MTTFFEETLGINLVEVVKLIIPILITFLVCKIAINVILKVLKKVLDKSKADKGIASFALGLTKVILYFMVILIITLNHGYKFSDTEIFLHNICFFHRIISHLFFI